MTNPLVATNVREAIVVTTIGNRWSSFLFALYDLDM